MLLMLCVGLITFVLLVPFLYSLYTYGYLVTFVTFLLF